MSNTVSFISDLSGLRSHEPDPAPVVLEVEESDPGATAKSPSPKARQPASSSVAPTRARTDAGGDAESHLGGKAPPNVQVGLLTASVSEKFAIRVVMSPRGYW